MDMTDTEKPERQSSILRTIPMRVTKPQRPVRKSARIKAIQCLKEGKNSKNKNLVQQSFPSNSINNTHSSNLQACEKSSDPDPRSSRKRKRSQGTEELVPQIKDQPINLERKTYVKENEDDRQLKKPKASRQAPQKVQFREITPETNNPLSERPASKSQEEEKDDPISYWAAHHIWPKNFAESREMSSSNNSNKRPRTLDHPQNHKEEKPRSYSQSRKDGDVPEQYTKSYEKYIFTHGLDMNDSKGDKLLSSKSKETCNDLQKINCAAVSPTIYTRAEILDVVTLCRNRNEAIVNRDITPLIVPPIKSLYLKEGADQFGLFTDEITTQWHDSWILAGPRPKPDLTVGFLSSAFTLAENAKLTNYTSSENLTRPTDELSFPFLMCEVKCGNEALDYADRQNMHSSSVAVKAILKLEQKADLYREDKQFEKLLGQTLVYSISHDQKDARLYGHYALVEQERWTYYRHHIEHYHIAHGEKALLALHSFVRNVLTVYAPQLLKRLQEAIAALPVSFMLPASVDSMLMDGDSQQGSHQSAQMRDADGFAIPVLPASAQRLLDEQKEQMNKLLQDSKEREERTERQMKERQERTEREMKEARDQMKDAKETIKELTDLLKMQIARN